jgi:hypothetical protein
MRTILISPGPCIVGIVLALAGCASSSPYRYLTPEQSAGCPGGPVPADAPCLHVTPERTTAYELHFVEFDDQGWLFPPSEPGAEGRAPLGSASRQIEAVMGALKGATDAGEGVNVVVYVHGWKHNAAHDDGDVGKFRRILSGVHAQEVARRDGSPTKPRKVVGIYVGWRGKSLTLGSIVDNVTFWDRKATALRVAQGSARELFARLTAFQRTIDDAQDGCPVSGDGEYRHCRVRMLLIGHSFGAWVLYSAISESLIQAVTRGVGTDPAKDGAARYGDMVVLLNPAFEASRYIPLRNAARLPAGVSIPRYRAPILVVVTSRADWATRYAFPAGRLISTVLQRPTSSSEQGASIGHTQGHMDGLITHELLAIDDKEAAACAGWQVPDDKAVPEAQHATIRRNYDIEERNERAFFEGYEDPQGLPVLKPGWQRTFCGGTKLVHLDGRGAKADPNSAIWNVRTYRDVIRDHNDITGSRLSSFVSQLYHDVTANPRVRDQTRRDGGEAVAGDTAAR